MEIREKVSRAVSGSMGVVLPKRTARLLFNLKSVVESFRSLLSETSRDEKEVEMCMNCIIEDVGKQFGIPREKAAQLVEILSDLK
jgi:hypothetical protein